MRKLVIALMRLAASLVICSSLLPLTSAEVLVSTENDRFYSLALNASGSIIIAGSRDEIGGFFELSGSELTFHPVNSLNSGGESVVHRVSADGRWIVGYSESTNSPDGYEATYWRTSSPDSPIGMGFLGGRTKSSAAFGIGCSNDAPVIVGSSSSVYGTVGFCWNQTAGMFNLARSGLPTLTSAATAVSSNSLIWCGTEDPDGPNTYRAVLFDGTKLLPLNSLGSSNSSAVNLSRDGKLVVGQIDRFATFWSAPSYAPTSVTLDGKPIAGVATAAEGDFVVGFSDDGFGWICDNSGKAKKIELWLFETFGLQVDHPILAVNDILILDGSIFLALEGSGILVRGKLPTKLEISFQDKGARKIRFPSSTGTLYKLQATKDLITWTEVPSCSASGTGSYIEFTVPEDGPAIFYRLLTQQ